MKIKANPRALQKKYSHVWRSNGYNFGYPTCCIEFFIKSIRFDYLRKPPYDKLHLTPFYKSGFTPCPECMEKDPQEVLAYISANRNTKQLPFPYTNRFPPKP